MSVGGIEVFQVIETKATGERKVVAKFEIKEKAETYIDVMNVAYGNKFRFSIDVVIRDPNKAT